MRLTFVLFKFAAGTEGHAKWHFHLGSASLLSPIAPLAHCLPAIACLLAQSDGQSVAQAVPSQLPGWALYRQGEGNKVPGSLIALVMQFTT